MSGTTSLRSGPSHTGRIQWMIYTLRTRPLALIVPVTPLVLPMLPSHSRDLRYGRDTRVKDDGRMAYPTDVAWGSDCMERGQVERYGPEGMSVTRHGARVTSVHNGSLPAYSPCHSHLTFPRCPLSLDSQSTSFPDPSPSGPLTHFDRSL